MSKETITFECIKEVMNKEVGNKVLSIKVGKWSKSKDIGVDIRIVGNSTYASKGMFVTFEEFNSLVECSKLIKNTYVKKASAKKTASKKAAEELSLEERFTRLEETLTKVLAKVK